MKLSQTVLSLMAPPGLIDAPPLVPLSPATGVVALFDEPNPANMLRAPTVVLGVFEEPNTADMLRSATNLVNIITY